MSIAFIGSYTKMISPEFGGSGEGIYTIKWGGEAPKIEVMHTMPATNPSYLALRADGRFLYAITEVGKAENPKVLAFQIMEDHSLHPLNEQPLDGAYPCHLAYVNSNVLVACYGSGNVVQFPVMDDGRLAKSIGNFKHEGNGPNPERQEAAHAHQIMVAPKSEKVYAVDLGIDRIKAYRFEGPKLEPIPENDIFIEKGGGARHAVFHPNGMYAYVLNELSGNVAVLHGQEGKLSAIVSYDSLPSDYTGEPSSSAIRIHPSGKYLYAGNRGIDAITIFEVRDDGLKVLDYQSTKGRTLREFNISLEGKHLIACHQDSNETVLYRIRDDGRLEEQFRTKAIVSPVCLVYL